MTGEGGFFTTPNYPKPYPVSIQCQWTIATVPGDTIELKFEEFHLENSGSCAYDFVDIRDGNSIHSPLIGKFCSSKIIGPINSTGNFLFIRLSSDGTVSEKGFKASWRRVSHTTPTAQASTTPMPSTPASTTLETTTRASTTTLSPTTPPANGKSYSFVVFDTSILSLSNLCFSDLSFTVEVS